MNGDSRNLEMKMKEISGSERGAIGNEHDFG